MLELDLNQLRHFVFSTGMCAFKNICRPIAQRKHCQYDNTICILMAMCILMVEHYRARYK